ncbi:MAG: hypothetical protein FWG79_04035 [Bacteroidales bacterium]|nr:hypothetical protein [Bacteroidales bacterium]
MKHLFFSLALCFLASLLHAQNVVTVVAAHNSLVNAVKNSTPNQIIDLDAGEYSIDEEIHIKHTLTIRIKEGSATRPTIIYNGTRNVPAFFIIHGDVHFTLEGIVLDGTALFNSGTVASGITPFSEMRSTYSVTARNSRFTNFSDSRFSAFRAEKGTMADELRFEYCSFDHILGDAIFLGAETDNRGGYNAKNINVVNCYFFKISGAGINVYGGGMHANTPGPQLHVHGNIFEEVTQQESSSTITASGAQVARIFDNFFVRSGRGSCVIRFDEVGSRDISVGDNNIYDSGRICSSGGNVVKGTITNNPPKTSIEGNLSDLSF